MSLRFVTYVLFLGLAFLTAVCGATCSNANLSGTFGFLSTGYDSPTQPGTSVGQYTFDGKGTVTGSFTHSNGTITSHTFTGTYAVAGDCSGKLTLKKDDGTIEHNNFIIDNANNGLQLTGTDTTQVKSGFAIAQGTVTCGLSGKRQVFASNVTGTNTTVGPVTSLLHVAFSGAGSLSGNGTLNLSGSIAPFTLTGSYTENSDCTGTALVIPSIVGVSPSNFYFVVVNGGKELLMVETDTDAIVSGNAQQ